MNSVAAVFPFRCDLYLVRIEHVRNIQVLSVTVQGTDHFSAVLAMVWSEIFSQWKAKMKNKLSTLRRQNVRWSAREIPHDKNYELEMSQSSKYRNLNMGKSSK